MLFLLHSTSTMTTAILNVVDIIIGVLDGLTLYEKPSEVTDKNLLNRAVITTSLSDTLLLLSVLYFVVPLGKSHPIPHLKFTPYYGKFSTPL